MANKPSLNPEQKEAFKVIQKFLDHPGPDTFVLKGYAGTGKTFLMQHLAAWLSSNDREFCLLASTGRASTVLRGKTGFQTRTVHSELYHFSKVDGDHEDIPEDAPIDQYGQMKLQFRLRQPDQKKRVYIIDESSMLSSEPSDDSIAAFGSGILLGDFFDAVGANKIIFVGDPCQLPPVKQMNSPSLDMDWLASQGKSSHWRGFLFNISEMLLSVCRSTPPCFKRLLPHKPVRDAKTRLDLSVRIAATSKRGTPKVPRRFCVCWYFYTNF